VKIFVKEQNKNDLPIFMKFDEKSN